MFALARAGDELSPELRRLIFVIPFKLRVTRREISFLRASGIFIPPNSRDERVPFVFSERLLQRHRLQFVCHGHGIMRLVPDAACARFRIDFYNKIEVVMLPRPFAEFHHLRKLVSGVDVQNREGHTTKKRFSRQPDENV